MKPIYLDNHSTTKLDPRVLKAMMPYFTEEYGNASSRSHSYGWSAEEAIDLAREQVAELVNANPDEIVFTSGATESNNIILHNRNNVLISAIEHGSVHNVCNNVVRKIKVNTFGELDIADLKVLTVHKPELISVMLVNNEIGTIQPLKKVRDLCSNIIIHSDMAQALGKIPIDVKNLGVDFASFSAHKMYGPKGIGALYINSGKKIKPLIIGGGQEFHLRAGTHNVPAIVGFGKACEIAGENMEIEHTRLQFLKKKFCKILTDRLGELKFYGENCSVPGNISVTLPCNDIDLFMSKVNQKIAISLGSACMSASPGSSRVLKAIGVSDEDAIRTIRIGIGRFNTEDEIILAAQLISDAVVL